MKKNLLVTGFVILGLFSGAHSSAKASVKASHKAAPKLDMSSIKNVVKANMPKVQTCYNNLLIEGMASSGKVVVTWEIDGSGSAQNVAVKDVSPEMQAVSSCITENIVSWKFEPADPEKPLPVTYTFNF